MSLSALVRLPTELLLIIVHLLDERNPVSFSESGGKPKSASSSPSHLHSLSLVCRYLRQLCLPPLFSRLKIAHTYQLQRFKDKCALESNFACLIRLVQVGPSCSVTPIVDDESPFRQLDLAHIHSPEEQVSQRVGKTYRYGPDILPALFSCLKSLEWLALDVKQIDANLLAIINSHPKLITVTTCDRHLEILSTLVSATSLSFSKIHVYSALLGLSVGFRSPPLHSLMGRSLRLAHLIVRGESNTKAGPGTLLVSGLETLDIGVYNHASLMSWLPAFVERHPNLQVIKFSGDGWNWTRNPDILFPLQFVDVLERKSLTGTVNLLTFSVSRTRTASSLDDWQVAHLEMEITKGLGVSALATASLIAPHISSLNVQMSRRAMEPVQADDLITSLCLFRSLRRLELHGVFKYLVIDGEVPWDLPLSDAVRPTSKCVVAHSALRWLATSVAQRTLSLDLIHITDKGYDLLNHRSSQWVLEVTYRVQQNRDIELHGKPRFVAGYRFPKPSCTIDPSSQLATAVLKSSTRIPPLNT
ncbi:hypothetical protein GGX14DRAFT_656928 [Mycena pura]|uniref:F-box domain-containing protein n=1 Tax=Mycena pura TaxID=153505 RepID=A0AAD6YLB4_9AGAR|nr:hypothetical protein GGX14DRAFT_656928 [Mycena pura]